MKKQLQLTLFFSLLLSFAFGQIDSVGIIGVGSPAGNWDDGNDTYLMPVTDAPHMWHLDSVVLNDGPFKFRANGAWDINWGANSFPYGVGTQAGPDITAVAGTYRIEFNDSTGVYYIENLHSNIGIIGDATPFEWGRDINMIPDTSGVDSMYFIQLDLLGGKEVKFRENDSWDSPNLNWGNDTSFPSGIAWAGGPNIKVDKPGTYLITFNTSTGAYHFERLARYETISIIGSATGDSTWTTEVDLVQDGDDANLWTGNVVLVDGEFKFRANHDWVDDWGGGEFPSDTAVYKSGDNIVATAGEYLASFNTSTLIYSFTEVVTYDAIGLIGTGTSLGNWDEDVDLTQDAEDKSIWTGRMDLLDGEVKFRANNAWDVSWGAADWPSGTASSAAGSTNIPTVAGDYKIWFNSTTGEYNFEAVVEYDTVSLIGRGSPFQDWDNDTDLIKDSTDVNLWTLTGVTLNASTSEDCTGDYGVKFRANHAWDINWGACDFPSGIGTQNGPNINVTATGLYDISFNSATGEYVFAENNGTATRNFLNPSDIHIYPNPANQNITIENLAPELKGEITISIYDFQGKEVSRLQTNSSSIKPIDVSRLTAGAYIVSIRNDKYTVGKKLSIVE